MTRTGPDELVSENHLSFGSSKQFATGHSKTLVRFVIHQKLLSPELRLCLPPATEIRCNHNPWLRNSWRAGISNFMSADIINCDETVWSDDLNIWEGLGMLPCCLFSDVAIGMPTYLVDVETVPKLHAAMFRHNLLYTKIYEHFIWYPCYLLI